MGKLGLAAVDLSGNLLGIRKLGNVLGPLAASTKDYAVTLGALSAEEGVAATGALALGDALAFARAAMVTLIDTVPIAAAVSAAFYELATGIKNIHDDYELANESGKSFWEVQKAKSDEAYSSLSNYVGVLKTMVGIKDNTYQADMRKRLGLKDDVVSTPHAPGLPQGYDTDTTMGASAANKKKDLPALPQDVSELTRKLAELTEKAAAAQRALALVGASPIAQQNAEILDRYNLFLADEKEQLDKLSPSARRAAEAKAHDAIATQISTDAITRYRTELFNLGQSTSLSIAEHLAMAAAIGKSAQAMQDAAVAAQVNQEMQKAYGNGWSNDPSKAADAEKRASDIKKEINAANQLADRGTLSNLDQQLAAQSALNSAILLGAEAKRQAAIASAQSAIRQDFADRKDTDAASMQAQIDLVREKSDAEKEANDLEHAASMDAASRYREQRQAILDAVAAAEKFGVAVDYREVLAANKQAWLEYNEAQDKAILASGGAVDGLRVALSQLARDTESAAQQMHDAVLQAVGAMNDAIVKVATEKHQRGSHDVSQAFSGAFRSISGSLAKTSLQKGESALLGAFGAGKPDGTSSNPWYVKMVGGQGSSGAAGAGGSLVSSLMGGVSNPSDGTSGTSSTLSNILGMVVQGMFADGTDSLIPGMPAIVGEKGPELFVPPSAGAIVPNSKLKQGFGGHHIENHIDARGSTDPAQTIALIHRYMTQAAPQIVATSVKAVKEGNARVAPSARR